MGDHLEGKLQLNDKGQVVGGKFGGLDVDAGTLTITDNTPLQPLSYGPYSVAPDLAVKQSYLINLAEAAIDRRPRDDLEIGYILMDYVRGRRDFARTVEALNEDIA